MRGVYFGKNIFLFFIFCFLWAIQSRNQFSISEHGNTNQFSISKHDNIFILGKNKKANGFTHLLFLFYGTIIKPFYEVVPHITKFVDNCSNIFCIFNINIPTSTNTINIIFTFFNIIIN